MFFSGVFFFGAQSSNFHHFPCFSGVGAQKTPIFGMDGYPTLRDLAGCHATSTLGTTRDPETNSKFAPGNGWLEDEARFLLGCLGLFSGATTAFDVSFREGKWVNNLIHLYEWKLFLSFMKSTVRVFGQGLSRWSKIEDANGKHAQI